MVLTINVIGLAAIAFTILWFLLSKPRAQPVVLPGEAVDILVKDGIYEPAIITVPAHKTIILRFLRQDPTPCAEAVVFAKINRSYLLPLNRAIEIKLDPQSVGEMEFTCQMGMYRGRLIIE